MAESSDTNLHFLDYWRVIRSRKEIILAVTLLVVLTGTAFTFTLPRVYMAEAKIEVRQDSMNVDVFDRQAIGGYNPYFLRTQYEILKSKPVLEQVIKNLDLAKYWGEKRNDDGSPLTDKRAYSILSNSINVQQFRDTSLIAIQVYLEEDPNTAADVANEIASVYREQRLSLKRRDTKRGVDALRNQLLKQQEKVADAEIEVQKVRKELGVSMIRHGLRADKLRLQQLEADRIAARVEMLVRKARYEQLHSLDGQELMNASSYLVNDQALSAIRRQLVDSEVGLRLLLENLGVNHPDVLRVQAGVDELKNKLNDALKGLKIGLRADYEVAKAKFEALELELSTTRDDDILAEGSRFLPFDKAIRNLDGEQAILNALKARVSQEGIELEVPRTPVVVREEAEPPSLNRPVSPNLMLNILLSIFIGLGAGIGLAYFIEYLDTSVKTVDDVERHLELPVVGIIPQKVNYLMEDGPDSPYAEAYRVLRTNLLFNQKDNKPGGAFTVSSGGVGEGKSTTLSNLAYVCAQLGNKVLIVDSDLRRPIQHTILGVSNRVGLTNVLMGDMTVEEAIKTTKVENLHFLPSGKLSKSFVGVFDSPRIRELVDNLRARYDYVFFDSPPLLGVSDASVLSSEVDAVLLVVQYRKYPRIISARAKRILENVGANIIGVVLNNINIMRDDYYYYYHSYHSPYYNMEEGQDPKALAETKTPAVDKDEF